MSSGIAVTDDSVTKFNELKLSAKYRYIIYKVSDDKKNVEVESTAAKTATYDDFLKALPANDCRYAVYDFEYTTSDGNRNKIVFYQWAPDSSNVKAKMLYSASKDALKKKLVGIAVEVQATDRAEVSFDTVKDRCSQGKA